MFVFDAYNLRQVVWIAMAKEKYDGRLEKPETGSRNPE